MSGRPPLGLTPKRQWQERCVRQRVLEIEAAIDRYRAEGKDVPSAWKVEHFEHTLFLTRARISPAGQAGVA